jgi:SPP1 gp7 family putative phage head morphogenesis protein
LSRNVIRTVDRKELVSELTQTIKHMANVNEKRAALIACDQVGKLNSQLAQYEQVNQGVEKYLWQTMEDSRVREKHRLRNQEIFRWDKPPDDGHTGWSYRCRCVAIPLYDTNKIGLEPRAGTYKIVR